MAGLTLSDTSNLSDMSAIVIASAIANVEPAGPAASLVHRVEIGKGQKQVNLPIWGRMSASALTEGVDMVSPTQVSVTVRNLTATEHGILSFVSNRLIRQNNENVLSTVGLMQGNAVGRLRESDVTGLFDGFSKSIPGAGNVLTNRILAGIVSYLRTDNDTSFGPAPSRPQFVLHPEQIRQLVEESTGMQALAGGSASSSAGAPAQYIPAGMSEDIIREYYRGSERRFGASIWESGVISRDGSDDAKGAAFAELALSLAMAQEVEANDDEDISLRGVEIATVAEWGELENVDAWGVEVYSDAVAIS